MPLDALVVYTQKQLTSEFKNAIQETIQVTYSIINLELKPSGMKGLKIFDNIIKKRLRSSGDWVPTSDYLDCSINYSLGQYMIYNPSHMNVSYHVLIQAAGGTEATMKLSTRRLNNIGHIKKHSGLANETLCLERMNNCNTLEESMIEIIWKTVASEDKNKK